MSSVDWAQIPLDDERPSYVVEKRVGNESELDGLLNQP